jgi:hypothetical protein
MQIADNLANSENQGGVVGVVSRFETDSCSFF